MANTRNVSVTQGLCLSAQNLLLRRGVALECVYRAVVMRHVSRDNVTSEEASRADSVHQEPTPFCDACVVEVQRVRGEDCGARFRCHFSPVLKQG